jgi:hypothetical protein
MLLLISRATADEYPSIGGHPIDPAIYQSWEAEGFLPVRPEMSDVEMAQHLDLSLPQLTEVKAAVDSNDAVALRKALIAYLNSKLPPPPVKPTGKSPGNHEMADKWIAPQYEFGGRLYKLGERTNWWTTVMPNAFDPNNDPGFAAGNPWAYLLPEAYAESGDPRYAEAFLTMFRSFYHNARPLAKLEWVSPHDRFIGAWHGLWISNRVLYFPAAYKMLGNFSGMTDEDRMIFLKSIWEHGDCSCKILDHRSLYWPPNHELGVANSLMTLIPMFPEFRDKGKWLAQCAQTYENNMKDHVLADGGAVERSGYSFGYVGSFLNNYASLTKLGAKMSPEFTKRLQTAVDFLVSVNSPTIQFIMFGDGGPGSYAGLVDEAAQLFPQRSDVQYLASQGRRGQPPKSTAKVFWQSGWLTMRSDWSREALFMGLNFNGTQYQIETGHEHEDLLSFCIWAYGVPFMTNSGSTSRYTLPEDDNWSRHTRGANTIVVDNQGQGKHDEAGRLESWASLPASGPGFTYLAAVSRHYPLKGIDVTHRRAVLFLRPGSANGYWLVYDVLTGDGKPHQYQWQGHFQLPRLTIDPATKSVATSAEAGKRLWLVPVEPRTFDLQQRVGPVATRFFLATKNPYSADRQMLPYVSLVKWGIKEPGSFAVLLCPQDAQAPAPIIGKLDVHEKGRLLRPAQALGCHVRTASSDDILALTPYPALRRYGTEAEGLVTDGEMAYIRRRQGKLLEAGLNNGRVLGYGGKRLLEAWPDIASVYVRFAGTRLEVTTQGRGTVSVAAGSVATVILNGHVTKAKPQRGMLRLEVGSTENLTISHLEYLHSPQDMQLAMGLERPAAHSDAVVVKWKTSVPTDAVAEYRKIGDGTWTRSVNPEPLLEHYPILTGLQHGATYELRLTCRTADGRVGKLLTTYRHIDPHLQMLEDQARADLLLWCKPDAGNALRDRSGRGNDGTPRGPHLLTSAGTASLTFDGEDDYAEFKAGKNLDKVGPAGTLEVWYKAAWPQGGLVAWDQENENPGRLVTALRGDSTAIWALSNGKAMQFGEFGAVDFNQWTHIALAWDGKTVWTYRNGKLVSTALQTVVPAIEGAPMLVGRSKAIGEQGIGNDYFKGQIGELRVYSQVLPAELIAQHYAEQERG